MQKVYAILLCLLIHSPTLFSQSSILQKTVSIGFTEGTVSSILKEVGTQGGFSFSYGQDISNDRHVSISNSDQTVQQFLEELFEGNVYYIEYGNKIILLRKPELPNAYSLQGRVTDSETKESIPGVTIYIPGTDPLVGTTSDKSGHFELKVPSDADRIQLSCIGYASDDLNPGNQDNVQIEMDPEKQELSEVQIVYYKPVKEAEVNSAVSIISSKKLEINISSSVEDILQGNAAGVHVVRNSGMPGSSIQVKIRGMNSLINCDPVYYLDGVYLQQSSLNTVSPHDIESIKIVKDASGTAKYGASAGNGVVLLHSKKGEPGKLSVTFNYTFGHQQVWKTPDLLNSEEFINWFGKFRPNDSTYQKYYDEDIIDSLVNEDWMEVVFHGAKTEDYHFSVSGGNKNSLFYIGSGYFKQEAIINNLEMNRYSIKIRSDHRIGKRLELGEDISLAFLDMKGLREGFFMNDFNNPIMGAMKMLPMDDKDSVPMGRWLGSGFTPNPTKSLEISGNSRKNYSLFSNLYTNVKLFKGLTYLTRFGLELYFQDNISFLQPDYINNEEYAVARYYNINDLAFDWKHGLEYSILISDNHSLNGGIEFEYGRIDHRWIPLEKITYNSEMHPHDNIEIKWKKPTGTEFIHQTWSGHVDYAYREKYQLSLNIRREKIGYYDLYKEFKELHEIYPAFSIGWIYTRESAFPLSWISYGKLRFGMGKAGISPRLNYSFFADMMREAQYFYALSSDITQLRSPASRRTNEKLFWEQVRGTNFGLDMGFFENKLFITVDYFYNLLKRRDPYPINSPRPIMDEIEELGKFGFDYHISAGTVNKGYEGEISWHLNRHALNLELGMNISHMTNEIADIRERDRIVSDNAISVHLPGEAAGSFYGYKIERVFTEEDCDKHTGQATNQPITINDNGKVVFAQPYAEAGDYKFADINADGIINDDDKVILGNPYPDYTIGLYQWLSYRNFDLSVFLQGVWGNEIFNVTKYWTYNPYGFCNWTSGITNSYRLPSENDEGFTDTDLHRVDAEDSNGNFRVSDFYVEDGSYLRLKNIQLGYTLPVRISQRAHIQKFRIWLGAQNLFTWTNYSGLDPEVGGWGIDCGIYPQPRVYMAGVNVEF